MRRATTLGAAALALILLVIVVLLASSGGDEDTSPSPSAPAPSSDLEGPSESPAPSGDLGALPPAFVECMAEQGYEITSSADIHSAPQPVLQSCFGASH